MEFVNHTTPNEDILTTKKRPISAVGLYIPGDNSIFKTTQESTLRSFFNMPCSRALEPISLSGRLSEAVSSLQYEKIFNKRSKAFYNALAMDSLTYTMLIF